LNKSVQVWTLADSMGAGERDAANSWRHPERIRTEPGHTALKASKLAYRFPPLSLTVLKMQHTTTAAGSR